eukprot:gene14832-14968_t
MPLARAAPSVLDNTAVHVATGRGRNASEAVFALSRTLPKTGLSAILLFMSPDYDPHEFAREMALHFPDIPVFGCTTAGELTPEGMSDGNVMALGFNGDDFNIVAQPIADLDQLTISQVRDHVRVLRNRLDQVEKGHIENTSVARPKFGMLLVDGLCLREEALISAISGCLDDIGIVGGSAGDGLNYQNTWVLFDGKAQQNAAILLLLSTDVPFRLFKCNSFEPTDVKLVVTGADLDKRIVRELNAEPAALEYARVVDVPDSELDDYCFAAHPVIVRVGGDYYARSIQRVNADGSLTFFCAIDEGLVLTVAGRLDTLGVVEDMFRLTEAELGEVSLYIGFDCIHRRLDAEQRQIARDLSDLYRRHRVVGFNTYGEQFGSMHLNQTFVGVAVGKRSQVTMIEDDKEIITRLSVENAKLKKINLALMSRVERGMSHPANAYGLFETAIALDNNVRQRTQELQTVLRSIERSNEALDQAKQLAERANSFKSTFLAFVSHDLLQPLDAARLGLSALMDIESPVQSQRLMGQVDRALTSLEDLIRTLLDISKLDAGVMKPEITIFELEQVIDPLRQEFESLAAARGLTLNIRSSKLFVQSDALMLRRILQNLLNNALHYTQKGGVLLGYRRRGPNVRIEVVDTGPGIASDLREEIFEEFQRGVVAPHEHRGFGLGLSIVRRLALALEHPIALESRLGFGSTFAVSVPVQASSGIRPSIATEIPKHAHYGLDGARVILIENEPAVAQAMIALLDRWGCKVTAVASIAEAQAALDQLAEKPDLIIADLRLNNGERGPDVVRSIRGRVGLAVPALIVTADHSPAASAEAEQLGLEILRKPVKPAELRSLMAYLLG